MRNIPNFNTEYNTLYMYSTKKIGSLFLFFFHNFAVCQMIAVCNRLGTRQTRIFLPCARPLPCALFGSTRQKDTFAVRWNFAVCFLS